MNKDPELNYYALKLAISLKGDDGDTFTKVYDEICKSASLTDEQVSRPFSVIFSAQKFQGLFFAGFPSQRYRDGKISIGPKTDISAKYQ